MKTSKLSSKSQLTIPSWARKALGLEPGDRVVVRVEDGRLIIDKAETSILRYRGALRGVYGDPDTYLAGLRAEWDREIS